MSNLNMIKDLRAITQAGMKDCKDALEETNWDLDKAVDLIKIKGKNIVSNNKVAAEGKVAICRVDNSVVMIEVNSVTDFVARIPEFNKFVDICLDSLCESVSNNEMWSPDKVENQRKDLVGVTKENIVISHWWVETMIKSGTGIFSYIHTNEKIGVILTINSSEANEQNPELIELGNDIALQITAMKPLAISADRLDPSLLDRQKTIFDTQIKNLNKPEASRAKIMEGKLNKWYTEVCLLDQELVTSAAKGEKISVRDAIKKVSTKLGCDIEVVNFIRCEVGEGIDKLVDNFADEAANMVKNEASKIGSKGND